MQRTGRAHRAEKPPWLRGEATYSDGCITLDPARAHEYQPFEERDLVFDLASVSTPDDALVFVRRYGLLRHGPKEESLTERFEDWQEEVRVLRFVMRLYLDLRRAIEGDEDGIARLWEMEPSIREYFQGAAKSDSELFQQVSSLIAWLVSEGLDGVDERIEAASNLETGPGSGIAGPPGFFLFSAHARDLVGLAYHQLALDFVNREPMSDCAECGRFFIMEDRRQRFCTPTCAGRARYRRWSAKNRRPGNERVTRK